MFHPSTFDYLKPTPDQEQRLETLRRASKEYATTVDRLLPDGRQKDRIIRQIRDVAMWINVTLTREEDGSPRHEAVAAHG